MLKAKDITPTNTKKNKSWWRKIPLHLPKDTPKESIQMRTTIVHHMQRFAHQLQLTTLLIGLSSLGTGFLIRHPLDKNPKQQQNRPSPVPHNLQPTSNTKSNTYLHPFEDKFHHCHHHGLHQVYDEEEGFEYSGRQKALGQKETNRPFKNCKYPLRHFAILWLIYIFTLLISNSMPTQETQPTHETQI